MKIKGMQDAADLIGVIIGLIVLVVIAATVSYMGARLLTQWAIR